MWQLPVARDGIDLPDGLSEGFGFVAAFFMAGKASMSASA